MRSALTGVRAGRACGREVRSLVSRLRALVRTDSGQDLLEYALLVAFIALAVVSAVGTTGTGLNTLFGHISTEMGKAATP